MNRTPAGHARAAQHPRVRDQARDVFAVMAFSACVSGALALAFLLLLVMGE